MKLVRGIEAWQACTLRGRAPASGTAVTIGNFDGVHVGHARMLQRVVNISKEHSLAPVAVSFDPLPQEFFSGDQAPLRLQGLRNRVLSMRDQGIEHLMLLGFNKTFSQLTPQQFIQDILINTLQVRHLVIGDDFRFGSKRAGDFNTLRDAGTKAGFTVEDTQTIDIEGERVSSTRVRDALTNNDLPLARRLLDRPYRIDGRVVHGEKVGRQLCFPTANVSLRSHIPPLSGVFAVIAHDADTGLSHKAVANLGERPTVGGKKLLLEVHLLDGNHALYGHHLGIDFMHFVRGEERFDSLDALKAQIARDAETARSVLN